MLAATQRPGQHFRGDAIVAVGASDRSHAICVQLDVVLGQNGGKLFGLLLQHCPVLDPWRGLLQTPSILIVGKL